MTIVAGRASDDKALPAVDIPGFWGRFLQPSRAFVAIALLFGIPLALLTAPFQAPDEFQHFMRAFQVSEGKIVPDRIEGRGGGVLPISIREVADPFLAIRTTNKDPRTKVVHEAKTSWAQIHAALHTPLNPGRRAGIPFVAAIYSPITYLPQSAAIAIGRMWELPPLVLMYMGRLANLMAWILMGWVALRITPACGRALFLLLLMPMSIFQAASLSADATTNGLAFVFVALVMRETLRQPNPAGDQGLCSDQLRLIGWGTWTILSVISGALTLAKFAYFPLIAMVLLIPTSRFGGRARYVVAMAFMLIVSFAPLAAWSPHTRGVEAVLLNNPLVSAAGQMKYLRVHPFALIRVPATTLIKEGGWIFRTFVGGRLGAVDVQLAPLFLVAYVVAMVAAAWMHEPKPVPPPAPKMALLILIPAMLSVWAIFILSYIFATAVGHPTVDGLQGRYLIPLAPGITFLIWSVMRHLPPHPLIAKPLWRLNIAAAMIACGSCSYTLAAIYFRYYHV